MPVKYQGELTFDLDCKHHDGTPNLALAITECNMLIDELASMGVPENSIELYASGGKGFHLMLDGRMFGCHRLVTNLPHHLHKYMASVVSGGAGITGTDLSLFCLGKGKLLRCENMLRSNGRYKAMPLS